MPDAVELATVRRGATGDMAAFSTGNRGGAVSIKLLPTSSIGPFLHAAGRSILRRGGAVVWNGSIHNGQQNISATLTRGVMTAAPRFPNMGVGEVANYVFTFEFEDIAPNYDAFVTV